MKVQTENKFKVEAKLSSFSATHRFYPNPSRVEKWRCDYNFKTMHKSSDFIFINCTSFRNILVKLFSISNRQCLVYDLSKSLEILSLRIHTNFDYRVLENILSWLLWYYCEFSRAKKLSNTLFQIGFTIIARKSQLLIIIYLGSNVCKKCTKLAWDM